MQMGKEEIKLPLVTDEKILHAENSKESRKTVRTNEFRKVAGNKKKGTKLSCISIISPDKSEKETKKPIPFV